MLYAISVGVVWRSFYWHTLFWSLFRLLSPKTGEEGRRETLFRRVILVYGSSICVHPREVYYYWHDKLIRSACDTFLHGRLLALLLSASFLQLKGACSWGDSWSGSHPALIFTMLSSTPMLSVHGRADVHLLTASHVPKHSKMNTTKSP